MPLQLPAFFIMPEGWATTEADIVTVGNHLGVTIEREMLDAVVVNKANVKAAGDLPSIRKGHWRYGDEQGRIGSIADWELSGDTLRGLFCLSPEAQEAVKSGSWPGRSVGINGYSMPGSEFIRWQLDHVALLGESIPANPGLPEIRLSAGASNQIKAVIARVPSVGGAADQPSTNGDTNMIADLKKWLKATFGVDDAKADEAAQKALRHALGSEETEAVTAAAKPETNAEAAARPETPAAPDPKAGRRIALHARIDTLVEVGRMTAKTAKTLKSARLEDMQDAESDDLIRLSSGQGAPANATKPIGGADDAAKVNAASAFESTMGYKPKDEAELADFIRINKNLIPES